MASSSWIVSGRRTVQVFLHLINMNNMQLIFELFNVQIEFEKLLWAVSQNNH